MRTDKQGAFPRGHMQRNMPQLCCDGSHYLLCFADMRHLAQLLFCRLAHCSSLTVLCHGGCIDRSDGDVNVAVEGLLVNMHESLGKRRWVRCIVLCPVRQVALGLWPLSELRRMRQCPHGSNEAVIREHKAAPATSHIQSACLTTSKQQADFCCCRLLFKLVFSFLSFFYLTKHLY